MKFLKENASFPKGDLNFPNSQNMFYGYNNMNNNFNPNFQYNNNYMFQQQQFYPGGNFGGKYYFNNDYNYYQQKNYYQKNKQPQVDEASLLESLKYVSEKYPHLVKLNQSYNGLAQKIRSQPNPRFFVIKSFTEEDIHKVTAFLKF